MLDENRFGIRNGTGLLDFVEMSTTRWGGEADLASE